MSIFKSIKKRLSRLQISEDSRLLILAIIVGAIIGLAIVVFRITFGILAGWVYNGPQSIIAQQPWLVLIILPIGGVLVGLLLHFIIGREKHPGVSTVIESVALTGGRLNYRLLPAKLIGSVISIGLGASVGPEDPSVQIGAAIGSAAGQKLKLSDERTRLLTAAGVGAGIAAVFNAPIAGMFFAIEVILIGEFTTGAFGIVVLASVVASIVSQIFLGTQPAFIVPAYELRNPIELVLYLGLGILAAIIAMFFTKSFYFVRDRFQAWHLPEWIKPALAAIPVAVLGLIAPRVLGVGYDTVSQVLTGNFGEIVSMLIFLIVIKIIVTNLSVGSGWFGGSFAPSLFIGALLGQAYGMLMQAMFGNIVAAPAAYAMVGMAAVLAGAVRAPLTSILLLFELTRDYRIILPLMLAVGVAVLVAEHWQKDGFYTLSLRRHGLNLERGRDVDVMQGITVDQAMTHHIDSVLPSMKAEALIAWFAATRHHGAPVIDEQDQLIGLVTLHDIDIAQEKGPIDQLSVIDICSRDPIVAYPDESLWVALKRLGTRDIGRLPVVSRDNPKKLIGMVRRQDIIKAYNTAIMEKMALRHKTDQVKLGQLTGTNILEVTIPINSPMNGKQLADVKWPSDCVVASIRRGRKVLVPHGSTQLLNDDVIVVVTPHEATQAIRDLIVVGSNGKA